MLFNDLLAFLIYSLLWYDKLVLIDHKDVSNVNRWRRARLRWRINCSRLLLDDWLNLELSFNRLRHLLLTIDVEGVWWQIQGSFVFLNDMFLKMWSYLYSTTSSNMISYFFDFFRAMLSKSLKEELLLIIRPSNFDLLWPSPSCKKSYYMVLMCWILDLCKICCLHTLLANTVIWLRNLQVWLTPCIILLLCWVIFSNNVFCRLIVNI